MLLDEVSNTTLAGLRVDPDDCFVGLPEIYRVDRKVRHVPILGLASSSCPGMTDPLGFETLFNGVLVRSRKCCKD